MTTTTPTTTSGHPHLTPETASLLESGNRAKIAWINRRRVYEYPERTAVLRALHDALYRRRDGEIPPAVVLTGPSRNGKTFILENLCGEHGRKFVNRRLNEPASPVIWPSDPIATLPTYVADEILDRFHGGPAALKASGENAEDLAIAFLRRHSPTELLVLDDLRGTPARDITDYIDRIRREAATAVVYTDTTDTDEDETETRRWLERITGTVHVHLPTWTPGDRLEGLLLTVEAETPLPEPSGLAEPDAMRRIAAAGGGTIGGILDAVRTLATGAVLAGKTSMTLEDLDDIMLRP